MRPALPARCMADMAIGIDECQQVVPAEVARTADEDMGDLTAIY
jgi:hypothetical protein